MSSGDKIDTVTVTFVEPRIFVAMDDYALQESLTFTRSISKQMLSEQEYLTTKETASNGTNTSWIILILFGLAQVLGNYSMEAIWLMVQALQEIVFFKFLSSIVLPAPTSTVFDEFEKMAYFAIEDYPVV